MLKRAFGNKLGAASSSGTHQRTKTKEAAYDASPSSEPLKSSPNSSLTTGGYSNKKGADRRRSIEGTETEQSQPHKPNSGHQENYGEIQKDYHPQSDAEPSFSKSVNYEECVICIEEIERSEAIFQCATCFANFHLPCVQSWVKSSLRPESSLLADILDLPNVWYCPSCRAQYDEKEYPKYYKCYCGKQVDPPDDPWLDPHTCGEKCDKQLKCGHRCMQLCHAGPCPPCVITVDATCFCGKQRTRKRCGAHRFSCYETCNKELECGHQCTRVCHPGECPPCDHTVYAHCACGKHSKHVVCKDRFWRCNDPCTGFLSCGNCRCPDTCHKGPCGPCPRSGRRTCPCGKTVFDNLSCNEETECCGDTCNKQLECGHYCPRRCHSGECGPCIQEVTVKCRCGRQSAKRKCGTGQFLCNQRCNKLRNCGRHACKRRCCDGDCPTCRETCGRTLNCGNHKCESFCHSDGCQPCPKSVEVTCACGASRVRVRCGMQHKVESPKCILRCRAPAQCNHEQREPHPCHYGPCPPCRQTCGATRARCGHICTSECHYPSPCPPCDKLVQRWCVGLHEMKAIKCSEPSLWACQRTCNNFLDCGKHLCTNPCHAVTLSDKLPVDDEPLGSERRRRLLQTCGRCERKCNESRTCPHPCLFGFCHSGSCPPCREEIRIRCFCGKATVSRECAAIYDGCSAERALERIHKLKFCGDRCHHPLPCCPHLCPLPCHEGECPPCRKMTTVRCKCGQHSHSMDCSEVQKHRRAMGKQSDPHFVSILDCNDVHIPQSEQHSDTATPNGANEEKMNRLHKRKTKPNKREEMEAARQKLQEREKKQAEKARRTRLLWKIAISLVCLLIIVVVYGPILRALIGV
eukprot:gb/GECG01003138.1/.p1 GENE.gb/GECG01003138.1/~~gb/GECG01003138.1/.p1  ORF type:complete len:860 (+),score=20.55 gb/GECG01003138.1/:1-2580(+)